jgi:hypothetical protein
MYSEEQLHEQSKLKENIYTVNGVPSRWEHNKKYSNFHFDPFIDPNTDIPFIIPVRFTNDFTKVVQKATNEHVEMTLGNYRKRNESKQVKKICLLWAKYLYTEKQMIKNV